MRGGDSIIKILTRLFLKNKAANLMVASLSVIKNCLEIGWDQKALEEYMIMKGYLTACHEFGILSKKEIQWYQDSLLKILDQVEANHRQRFSRGPIDITREHDV